MNPSKTDSQVAGEDLRELMTVLGIPLHARPVSPHEVFQNEVLPKVQRIMTVVETAQKHHDWLCDLEKMGYPPGHAPICRELGLGAALDALDGDA